MTRLWRWRFGEQQQRAQLPLWIRSGEAIRADVESAARWGWRGRRRRFMKWSMKAKWENECAGLRGTSLRRKLRCSIKLFGHKLFCESPLALHKSLLRTDVMGNKLGSGEGGRQRGDYHCIREEDLIDEKGVHWWMTVGHGNSCLILTSGIRILKLSINWCLSYQSDLSIEKGNGFFFCCCCFCHVALLVSFSWFSVARQLRGWKLPVRRYLNVVFTCGTRK